MSGGTLDDMREVVTPEAASSPPTQQKPGWLQRGVRWMGWTLISLGLFLLGFVAHQLFITTWFAQQNNAVLESRATTYFQEVEVTEIEYVSPGPPELVDPEEPPPIPAKLTIEEAPPRGQPFAIIRIPTIDRLVDGWAVVEGVTRANLKNGAGHMPTTPLPGQPGNSVISGHRTTWGAPFHELDTLEPGDEIHVETAAGVHIYVVRSLEIVDPTALWVTGERDGAWLTLTTCHPKFSSRQRLIVFAEMVDGPNHRAIYG